MSNRSLAKKSDIRVGKSVWILDSNDKPQKVIIGSLRYSQQDKRMQFMGLPYYQGGFCGDLGLEGSRYDNRPAQVFLNKRSALYWGKVWNGRNPNFYDAQAQVWFTRGDVQAIIRATETTLQLQAMGGRPHNTEPMVTP